MGIMKKGSYYHLMSRASQNWRFLTGGPRDKDSSVLEL